MTTARRRIITPPPLRRPALIDDLALTIVGSQAPKRERVDMRFAVHGVAVVLDGRGDCQVDREAPQPVEPPCFFPVYPGPRFRYGPPAGASWDEYHICFLGKGVERLVRWNLIPTDGRVRRLNDATGLAEQFDEVRALIQRGRPGDTDRAILAAEALLVDLCHRRSDRSTPTDADPEIDRVIAACERRLAESIDFERLAAEHAMSYSSLRQRVRRRTGLPPGRYLARLRCEAACKLLSDSPYTVAEIGRRVGIDDPFTFSRTFRRCVGLSPRQYRAQAAPPHARGDEGDEGDGA